MATELKRKLDYDDYVRFPDDGQRHEILDGEPHVTPAPSPVHQRVSPDWPDLSIILGDLWR